MSNAKRKEFAPTQKRRVNLTFEFAEEPKVTGQFSVQREAHKSLTIRNFRALVDSVEKGNSMQSDSVTTGADNEQTAAVQCAASNETTTKTEEAAKRVLVVDDTEDIVKLVKMYLEHHHYEVITAYDGQEGLDKAKTDKPDLIVLDLMLPRINGYKICGLLKRDKEYAKIPIILFTAKTQEKDMKLGQEVGADAYLTKPFEPEILLAKIKELIEKQNT